MSLGVAITRIAQYLSATLPSPPGRIGGASPVTGTDVPALVLSMRDATEVQSGVGNRPRPPQRRPLEVTSVITLADPMIRFPDGDVPLLSHGGTVLRLPHGSLVHADGEPPPPPLGAADLSLVLDGTTTLQFTSGPPAPGEFRFDEIAAEFDLDYGDPRSAGVVRFNAPLVGTSLTARYFVGEYELTATRFRGLLDIDVVAANIAAVDALSDAVGAALRPGTSAALGTAHVFTPVTWGVIGGPESTLANARRRTLTFRFDVELEDVRLPTGGGVIARVDVHTELDLGKKPPPPLPTDRDFSHPAREEIS